MIKVLIGIQARSTSSRLPDKATRKLGQKMVLDHVLESCEKAANYINRFSTKGIQVQTMICAPKGDKLLPFFQGKTFEGPEEDVLKRYFEMAEFYDPQYVVRITGDCPLVPSFLISKLVTTSVQGVYDYLSNSDEKCRTSPDGWDVEVISRAALKHTHEKAVDKYDREHVTTWTRRCLPKSRFKMGTVINFLDLSDMKISLDTEEDFERIRKQMVSIESAVAQATAIYGPGNVHRV